MVSEHEAFSRIAVSGGIKEFRLRANGLRVLLYAEAVAPVVTVMVTYRVGSGDEAPGQTGAMHFLEHLMFKGTERFNKQRGTSVFEVLQRVGAQVNATTSKDRTNYYAVLPREYVELAIEIEADRMRGALLLPEEVEAERSVILNEMDRAENEPLGNLYRSLWSTAYTTHPYRHPIIGWRGDVEGASSEGLREIYDTYYWPDNATVSVIGDFDADHVLALLARHFGQIASHAQASATKRVREPRQREQRRFEVHAQGHMSALMMGYKVPETLHTDIGAIELLGGILSAGKTSRFYRCLTDRGLTAQATMMASASRDPGLLVVVAILAPGRTHQEVEDAICEEIERVQKEGIGEEELQRVKNQLVAMEAFSRDGSFSIAASLNEAIAAGDWMLFTTFRERLERFTVADVQRVAQTYLRADNLTVAWHIPEG